MMTDVASLKAHYVQNHCYLNNCIFTNRMSTIITFISYWLIGFPVSWFLGKEDAYGSFGIWLGLLAGLSTAAISLYIRFNYLTLKLIKEKH